MKGPWIVIHKDGTYSEFERYDDALADLQREYPYTWREKVERAVLQRALG